MNIMKKLLLGLFAVVVALFGATKLNLVDVRPLPGGPSLYLTGVAAGSWIPVALDPAGSVTIDTSVSPAVLKVAAGAALTQAEDDFLAASGVSTFTTSAPPKGRLDVYQNGLLQRGKGDDYQISGAGLVTVTFARPLDSGTYVTLLYLK